MLAKSRVLAVPFQAPCLDCNGRYVGCHSDCEKYGEFKMQMAEYNKSERKRGNADYKTDAFLRRGNRLDKKWLTGSK